MNFNSFLIAKDFMYKETTDDSETLFVRVTQTNLLEHGYKT